MTAVAPLPLGAEFFLDARGGARSLRVRWHRAEGLVVLSLWRGAECTGTFRLEVDEVPALIEALRTGLDTPYDESRNLRDSLDRPIPSQRGPDQEPLRPRRRAASPRARRS